MAVLLLLFTAVTLFYPVPAPPQRWFGYCFLAFVCSGLVLVSPQEGQRLITTRCCV